VTFLGAVAALVVLIAVVWALTQINQGLPAIRQILERPTTPLDRLAEGPAEVAGVLEVEGPVTNLRGQPCALITVEVHSEWTTGSGKQQTSHHEARGQTFCARVVTLRQGVQSARLLVTPETVSVSADERRRAAPGHQQAALLARCPAYADLAVEGAQITVVERCIRAGKPVLVSGQAAVDEQAEPSGYREGAGRAFKLGPTADRKLLVSSGTQGQLLARLAGPGLMALLIASVLVYVAWWALDIARRV